MSYVPHMGYARPHTPGVRRRREDEIHTWRVGHAILASILLTLLLVVLLYRLVRYRRRVQEHVCTYKRHLY